MGQIDFVDRSWSFHLLANYLANDLEIFDVLSNSDLNDVITILYRMLRPISGAQTPLLFHLL